MTIAIREQPQSVKCFQLFFHFSQFFFNDLADKWTENVIKNWKKKFKRLRLKVSI